ncbi:MAG: hypothetical protein JW795_20030 [Chitinivibrionales bacterium]|nr:hypothetical protein [Chitinivibrionales bacterium]
MMFRFTKKCVTGMAFVLFASMIIAQDRPDPDMVVPRGTSEQAQKIQKKKKAEPSINSISSISKLAVTLPSDGKTGVTMVHAIKKIGTTNFTKRYSYENGGLIPNLVITTIDSGALVSSGQIRRYNDAYLVGWYTIKNILRGKIGYHYNNGVVSSDSVVVGCYDLSDISHSVNDLFYSTVGWTVAAFAAGKTGTSNYAYYCAKSTSPTNFNNIMVPTKENVVAIDKDENGYPWVVLNNGDIYRLVGNDFAANWVKKYTGVKANRAVDVCAGSGKIYFCGLNKNDTTYTLYELKDNGSAVAQVTHSGETVHAKRVDITAYQWLTGAADVWYVSAKPDNDGDLYIYDTFDTYSVDNLSTGKYSDVGAVADQLQ